MAPPRTYLAFDYGTVRTGVAVGQTLTHTATPLPALMMANGRVAEDDLDALINAWQPKGFIIGLPATPSADARSSDPSRLHPEVRDPGGGVNIARRVRAFAAYLGRRYGLVCHFVDERLTTRTVLDERRALRDQGKDRQDGAAVDSRVAEMLLCEWMRQHDDACAEQKTQDLG